MQSEDRALGVDGIAVDDGLASGRQAEDEGVTTIPSDSPFLVIDFLTTL